MKMTHSRQASILNIRQCSSDADRYGSVSSTICFVCMETYHGARILQCGHVFCRACLEHYYHTYQNTENKNDVIHAPCPTCYETTALPPGGIIALPEPQDHHRKASIRKGSVKGDCMQTCDVCFFKDSVKDADYCCRKCNLNFCEKCNANHNHHPMFTTHSTFHISTKETLKVYCERHNCTLSIYYCFDCNIPVCNICLLDEHNIHQSTKLREALVQRRDNLRLLLNSLKPKITQAEKTIDNVINLDQTYHLDLIHNVPKGGGQGSPTSPVSSRPLSSLQVPISNYKFVTDMAKNLTVNDMKHVKGEAPDCHPDDVSLDMTSLQFHINSIRAIFDFGLNLTEISQSKKLLGFYVDSIKRIQTLMEHDIPYMQDEIEKVVRDKMEAHAVKNKPKHKISDSSDDTGICMKADYDGSPCGSLQELMAEQEDKLSMLIKPKLIWKLEKQKSDPGELMNPCDVSFLPDGNILVAEYDIVNDHNNKLRIFDQQGKVLDSIAKGEVRPLGTTITREGHIAVTDCKGKRVKIFNTAGQLITEFGKGQFGWPYGIAVNSRGQFIVTDVFNDTVSLFQPDGKRIKHFGGSGRTNHTFKNPYHVTVDASDNIYVSDSGNHCIKKFDSSGKLIHKMGTKVLNADLDFRLNRPKHAGSSLKAPRGIGIDHEGHILVADDRSRVCMFSQKGMFIRNLLTEDDSVKYAEALAIGNHGQLVITEWNPANMFAVKMFNIYE